MSPQLLGALLGAVGGLGLVLAVARMDAIHRPTLAMRVLPYVRDVPRLDRPAPMDEPTSSPVSAAAGVFGPLVRAAADAVERILGGSLPIEAYMFTTEQKRVIHRAMQRLVMPCMKAQGFSIGLPDRIEAGPDWHQPDFLDRRYAGVYDEATIDRVRDFQRSRSILPADGKVGVRTWGGLREELCGTYDF